ncbi:hypothetical protein RIF25_09015 [Thermosynechococcaceae cyanobacterium BACA0444]|uniref:Uncharacterized protein n=1 Tax=Pseudocalidococcus azoricus BACA0444 TaxID=2918990 RepID=A0AAE4JXA6_9CYAN|nr:hypothetical protein [Pseudocalidococcus azoricus]MDS3860953.1 hypothetical protein [Pseudocalidococcus azoricus BACA0444]
MNPSLASPKRLIMAIPVFSEKLTLESGMFMHRLRPDLPGGGVQHLEFKSMDLATVGVPQFLPLKSLFLYSLCP